MDVLALILRITSSSMCAWAVGLTFSTRSRQPMSRWNALGFGVAVESTPCATMSGMATAGTPRLDSDIWPKGVVSPFTLSIVTESTVAAGAPKPPTLSAPRPKPLIEKPSVGSSSFLATMPWATALPSWILLTGRTVADGLSTARLAMSILRFSRPGTRISPNPTMNVGLSRSSVPLSSIGLPGKSICRCQSSFMLYVTVTTKLRKKAPSAAVFTSRLVITSWPIVMGPMPTCPTLIELMLAFWTSASAIVVSMNHPYA